MTVGLNGTDANHVDMIKGQCTAANIGALTMANTSVGPDMGSSVTGDLSGERELQTRLEKSLRASKVSLAEGTEVSGGELDLIAENAILIENKYSSKPKKSIGDGPGVQGRRYAISLSSQVVIVVSASKAKAGEFPDKANCVSVRPIAGDDLNRVQICFDLPFGAVPPSAEKALKT